MDYYLLGCDGYVADTCSALEDTINNEAATHTIVNPDGSFTYIGGSGSEYNGSIYPTVPEPATLTLLGTALAALGGLRRRRTRRRRH